jgi:hypothetical protein
MKFKWLFLKLCFIVCCVWIMTGLTASAQQYEEPEGGACNRSTTCGYVFGSGCVCNQAFGGCTGCYIENGGGGPGGDCGTCIKVP